MFVLNKLVDALCNMHVQTSQEKGCLHKHTCLRFQHYLHIAISKTDVKASAKHSHKDTCITMCWWVSVIDHVCHCVTAFEHVFHRLKSILVNNTEFTYLNKFQFWNDTRKTKMLRTCLALFVGDYCDNLAMLQWELCVVESDKLMYSSIFLSRTHSI